MHYVIYDQKSGNILQVHTRVDAQGKPVKLSHDEVLSRLDPKIEKSSVGVVEIKSKPEHGHYHVDPKTHKLTKRPH